MKPVLLDPNPVRRFYRGGSRIGRFRNGGRDEGAGRQFRPWGDDTPEDWVGSTTPVFGSDGKGLSVLPDGRLLLDAVAQDPLGFLGPAHLERFGADPGLLVKLLHAGERLPVHSHPDRRFASRYLRSRYGKTEGWVVLEADPGASVFVGFRARVAEEELRGWVGSQDAETMLRALNPVPVRAGDTMLVPAGTPHSIGGGILLAELQEPTDFSILLEWDGFDADGAEVGHLSLGFDLALRSVSCSPLDERDLATLSSARGANEGVGGEILFPAEADPFFRAERIICDPPASLSAEFSIVVAIEGAGALVSEAGELAVEAGDTLLVPYAAGRCRMEGKLSVLRCRSPAFPPPRDGSG